MIGRFIIAAAMLLLYRSLPAQEFWMMPDKFQYGRGDTIRVRFNVGENFVGETWNLREERISSVSLHTNSNVADLKAVAAPGRGTHLKLAAGREGTFMITMARGNALVELPADRFNEYLK